MRFLRSTLPFVMIACLFAGSVASAATPCCCLHDVAQTTQAQDMPDAPCHDNNSATTCGNCGCMHHASMSPLPEPEALVEGKAAHVAVVYASRLTSHLPEVIFQPPRLS